MSAHTKLTFDSTLYQLAAQVSISTMHSTPPRCTKHLRPALQLLVNFKIPARGLVVSASASVLVGREFDSAGSYQFIVNCTVSHQGFPEPENRFFRLLSTTRNPFFLQLPNPGILKILESLLHSNISNSDNTEVADWRVQRPN